MSNMSIALKYYSPEALEEFAEETNTHLGAITSYIAYTGKWDKDDYDEAFCGRMDRDELADYLVTAFVDAHNISETVVGYLDDDKIVRDALLEGFYYDDDEAEVLFYVV